MAQKMYFFGGPPSRLFLQTRIFSTSVALVMALYYTKLLGLEKRSILSFIMVTAIILTVVFTSGISLTFRNQSKNQINGERLFAFLALILASGLLVGVMSTLLLRYYSSIHGNLPSSIYVACFLYSSLGCIQLGVLDGFIAKGNLRLASYFDLSSIAFQVLFLFFLIQLNQLSAFMSVILSFIISYLLISFAAFSVFFHSYPINVSRILRSGMILIIESKHNQIFGIANGFVDRIDRFIIGLALPMAILAKYSLITGIISYTRFLPETINKIRILNFQNRDSNSDSLFFIRRSSLLNKSLLTIVSVAFTFLAIGFVELVFGKEWSLPIEFSLLFTLQELMRSAYQMQATSEISRGNSSYVNRLSLFFLGSSILLMCLGVSVLGIMGVPLSMIIIYSCLMHLVSRKIRNAS
jgi:O-antigen/teichoic acid export membrane protein